MGVAYPVDSGIGKSWCYTQTFSPGQGVIIYCVLFGNQWSALYGGDPAGAKVFYQAIAGAHNAKK